MTKQTKQTILFDLDDTLIHCNRYFYLVINQFVDAMSTWFGGLGITPEAIRDKQTAIDIAGVQIVGFMSDHFPQSFIETYRYFSDLTGRARSAIDEDLLWKLGRSVYEQEVEPYPNMEYTLDRLAEDGHELHLYTGGEFQIQQRKIKQMQLERYFGSRIYVRPHKNVEAMEGILTEGGYDRSSTWMIGNSIRTDVLPALKTGINAIHMKSETEWAYNIVGIDVEPKGAFITLSDLKDVPPAIDEYVHHRLDLV